MLAAIAIAIIAAALSTPTNWPVVIWTVITAMWAITARVNQLTAEDWEESYSNIARELVKLREKYQALDNEYLKLAKQNEATSKENVQLHERLGNIGKQHNDAIAKYETTVRTLELVNQELQEQLSSARPATTVTVKGRKKTVYSDKDIARIKAELRAAGLTKEEE